MFKNFYVALLSLSMMVSVIGASSDAKAGHCECTKPDYQQPWPTTVECKEVGKICGQPCECKEGKCDLPKGETKDSYKQSRGQLWPNINNVICPKK